MRMLTRFESFFLSKLIKSRVSTSDALALVFGVVSAVLAGIAIFMARKARIMMNDVIDIEAHPLVAGSQGASTIGKRQVGNN
ncbi:hypothetical protein BPAE_0067g00430 [Botrytis paeoniae]|uniref:Uncharacterized protein n=1 Tax=Botrytis paeoniae TaxID=278948 RepID=A0A4Z1FRT3_9HELO|nr:hypothetical protein BPAE_0067g00430 [Botrytis paeoniae]